MQIVLEGFLCSDGILLCNYSQCDGEQDCLDGGDEFGCDDASHNNSSTGVQHQLLGFFSASPTMKVFEENLLLFCKLAELKVKFLSMPGS